MRLSKPVGRSIKRSVTTIVGRKCRVERYLIGRRYGDERTGGCIALFALFTPLPLSLYTPTYLDHFDTSLLNRVDLGVLVFTTSLFI